MSEKEDNDFNPKEEIAKITANIYQPDKFAQIFCEAASTQKIIDNSLKKIIKDLIKDDPETINAIKTYQREVDREDWKNFLKKVGLAGWTFITLIVGAILGAIAKKFIGP